MTVLVIGGTGYLGSRVVEHAATRHPVVATHFAHPPSAGPAQWFVLDLRVPRDVHALIELVRPRMIVNCAYVQSGPDVMAVTARAPGVMAAAAGEIGARFVHVSSDVIFAGRSDRAYVETDPPAPVHAYGRAKADAEVAVRAHCAGALIIRTSLLYGGSPPGGQERLVTDALAGAPIQFFTDEVRSPIRGDDLAGAILELVEEQATGVFNVAGADAVDRLTFARLLAASRHGDASSLVGRPLDPALGPRPGRVALDSSKARAVLRRTRLAGVHEVLGPR